ncbi:conserved protein of unknown function [Tenacibaculum sp. 190524A02b]|uniref:hypothetical protein n=1 Tax=Tenacibaculum vairaonense TaxID=3137860 RepID=UPI0032B2935A
MKYFELKNSTNIKEVGKLPQSEDGYFGDVQQSFIPFEGLIDFDFKLPEPKLEKKAKQTSFLNVIITSGKFLVIDDDFLNFLKDFNIGEYQSWKIKIYQEKELIEKYNLFFLNDIKQSDYIDYTKSKFYKGKFFDYENKGEIVEIINYQDFLEKREAVKNEKNKLHLLDEKIVFDLRRVKEDMFKIMNSPRSGYYISERLKEAIEAKGLTGMSFTEIGDLKNVEVIY